MGFALCKCNFEKNYMVEVLAYIMDNDNKEINLNSLLKEAGYKTTAHLCGFLTGIEETSIVSEEWIGAHKYQLFWKDDS